MLLTVCPSWVTTRDSNFQRLSKDEKLNPIQWEVHLIKFKFVKEKKRKDSAGSDDTASMIKGGGYLGARTRQPPTAQTIKKK
jgi:hypothetical protein